VEIYFLQKPINNDPLKKGIGLFIVSILNTQFSNINTIQHLVLAGLLYDKVTLSKSCACSYSTNDGSLKQYDLLGIKILYHHENVKSH